jgi:hypothetical protein
LVYGGHVQRNIELTRIFNVRDLGGYAQIPWRRLFRGAGLHRLDGDDARVIRALGLRTVLDLRTVRELEKHGTFPLPAEVVNLPMIPGKWDMGGLDETTVAADYLLARYVEMLDTGAEAIAKAFTLLRDPERYPVMLFCAGGKDRTGVLVALLLATLGVDDATIAADYALSEAGSAKMRAARADAGETMLHLHPALFAAPAPAMLRFLAHIREQHGSIAGFLEQLGVARAHLEEVRVAALASGRPASIARNAPGDQVS